MPKDEWRKASLRARFGPSRPSTPTPPVPELHYKEQRRLEANEVSKTASKKQKRREKRQQQKARRTEALSNTGAEQETIRIAGEACGIKLTVSFIHGKRRQVPHWQFRLLDGSVLLHWWPSKGSWWNPHSGRKGSCRDPHLVLLLARYLLGEVDAEAVEELKLHHVI